MNITQPARDTFWRAVFFTSAALPFLSIWQSINLARKLEVDFLTRPSWMGLLIGFFLLGLIPLLAWTLTWSRLKERIFTLTEFPEHILDKFRWLGWVFLPISIIGYTVFFTLPSDQGVFKTAL